MKVPLEEGNCFSFKYMDIVSLLILYYLVCILYIKATCIQISYLKYHGFSCIDYVILMYPEFEKFFKLEIFVDLAEMALVYLI